MELMMVETRTTFDQAAARARRLSAVHDVPVVIVRHGAIWQLRVETVADFESAAPVSDDREQALLLSEIGQGHDDLARSVEEGWFYDDDA